ncbi:hypothetical protein CEXT_411091 [Caerostris extrusa]|uniref:Uncharacterized protein n=1 Tax=Caerostris extrusa TaxID=172846 RepID=A0AAV4SSK7_CAEEX|nr:hypothetical protein CEXT_411091 [Caerostris extrusa]
MVPEELNQYMLQRAKSTEQRERKRQYMREWYQRAKSTVTPEQRERKRQYMREWYQRAKSNGGTKELNRL